MLPKAKPTTSRADRTASAVHASATYKRGASGRSKDAAPADLTVTVACLRASTAAGQRCHAHGWPINHINEMRPWITVYFDLRV